LTGYQMIFYVWALISSNRSNMQKGTLRAECASNDNTVS
jgi:hypothetical protein